MFLLNKLKFKNVDQFFIWCQKKPARTAFGKDKPLFIEKFGSLTH